MKGRSCGGAAKLTRPLGELRIPPTVQAILAARIDHLPPAGKDLLQTLAVIGNNFSMELVKIVAGKNEEQLEPSLADLQFGEFIYEQPSLAGAEYTFKHALTQEVAYNSVLAERRRAIHDQTARAMEGVYAQQLENHYTELAHHYIRGNDAAKALRYAHLAAEQAVSRAAYVEATSMLEAGLKLLDKLPEGVERLRAELALRSVENTVAYVLYGSISPQRESAVRCMCDLGERIGEADQLLRGLVTLGHFKFAQGEIASGLELSRRCLEVAATVQDAGLLAYARWTSGGLAVSCGNLREGVSYLEGGIRGIDRPASIPLLGVLYGSAFPGWRAIPFHLLGRVDDAVTLADDGLRHARESRHLFSLGLALIIRGLMAHFRREPESARAYNAEAIALSEENGFPTWLAAARFYNGRALAELGQLEQGIAEMEAAEGDCRRHGVTMRPYRTALLADAYARIGRREEALGMLNDVLAQIERTGEKREQAEILRFMGEVLLMGGGGATEEAERFFRAALGVARAQEARWWELRATTSLTRLLAKRGHRNEARTMLAEIYGWFTEGFDTADLKDAKALLDELNA
jgi:tetratricopeptide (TPR) repeat protein